MRTGTSRVALATGPTPPTFYATPSVIGSVGRLAAWNPSHEAEPRYRALVVAGESLMISDRVVTCVMCRGTGDGGGGTYCDVCRGVGKVRVDANAVRCAICRGTGYGGGGTACEVCKGIGLVTPPKP